MIYTNETPATGNFYAGGLNTAQTIEYVVLFKNVFELRHSVVRSQPTIYHILSQKTIYIDN